MNKVHKIITDSFIEACTRNESLPWQRPWSMADMPANYISKKPYNGINTLLLLAQTRSCPYWITFNQLKEKNQFVKSGSKAVKICYYGQYAKEDTNGDEHTHTVLRYYQVFNVQDTTLELPPAVERKPYSDANCQAIVDGYIDAPPITNDSSRAYYKPRADEVHLPPSGDFHSLEGYYSTLFHELIHSTGHPNRLSRFDLSYSPFGSADYSKEELVAEIGASFLAAHAGLVDRPTDNSLAYVQGWLGALASDISLLPKAASAAQKASNYILNGKELSDDN